MQRRELLKAASVGLVPGGIPRILASGRAAGARARGVVLSSSRDPESPVAVCPRGRRIATAEKDCHLKVWDAETGALLWIAPGPGHLVHSLAFSQDGAHLASGGRAAWVEIERSKTPVGGRADKPFRQSVISDPQGRQVSIWDLATKQEVTLSYGLDGSPIAYVSVVDDKSVVGIDSAGRVSIWAEGRAGAARVAEIPQRPGEATCPELVAVDGSGRRVASVHAQADGVTPGAEPPTSRARLLDLASGRYRVICNSGEAIWSLAISRDGTRVATGSGNASGTVTIWGFAKGDILQKLPAAKREGIRFVSFSPDGSQLAACTIDGDLRLWDCSSGRLIRAIAGPACLSRAIAFLPTRMRIVSGGLRFAEPDPETKETPLEPLVSWLHQFNLI